MFVPHSYDDLCAAMKTRAKVTIDRRNGKIVGLAPLHFMDGSSRGWTVTLQLFDHTGHETNETDQVVFHEGY